MLQISANTYLFKCYCVGLKQGRVPNLASDQGLHIQCSKYCLSLLKLYGKHHKPHWVLSLPPHLSFLGLRVHPRNPNFRYKNIRGNNVRIPGNFLACRFVSLEQLLQTILCSILGSWHSNPGRPALNLLEGVLELAQWSLRFWSLWTLRIASDGALKRQSFD